MTLRFYFDECADEDVARALVALGIDAVTAATEHARAEHGRRHSGRRESSPPERGPRAAEGDTEAA